jgi:acetoin utilization protein AcuC
VSNLPHFYYSDAILNYNFGPQHPLKPERLRRAIELLGRFGVETIDPGQGKVEDLLRVHSAEYIEDVRSGGSEPFGFGRGDNPAFPGMWDASLAYVAATVKAAESVRDGAPLAFGIGGGLHHAMRSKASGFCIFDDPAIACHILLERFDRVAYVDIDVHHGDGVQWIYYEEPRVLTCSIHEEGRTLFPGTGFVEETGAEFSSLNVPVMAYTTGDVWLDAFERGILPGLERFQPQAIVLQLGTDTHRDDPLGHVKSDVQSWVTAVRRVMEFKVPIVAVGGGGYNLTTVPRMWAAACLTLGGVEFEDRIPPDLAEAWGMPTFFDPEPEAQGIGREYAEGVVDWLSRNHHPNIGC